MLSVQAVEGVIRTLQFYIDDLLLATNLLKTIYSQLSISEIDDSISIFIYKKFNIYQEANKLLQEIEAEVECSINQWGVKGHISPNLIKDKLINKIPSVIEICNYKSVDDELLLVNSSFNSKP